MKRILICTAFLFAWMFSIAQTKFRIEGGLTLPGYSYHDNSGDQHRGICLQKMHC